MKNLTVLYSFPLRMGTTGIGMTAWHQVNSLLKQGVKVILCCGSLEKELKGLTHKKETFKIGNIKIPIKPFGMRSTYFHDKITANYLKNQKIDVVHCWPLGSLATIKKARSLGIPTFLERPSSHTRYVFEVVNKECEKLNIAIQKKHYAAFNTYKLTREEKEFDQADYLLCPSDFVIETFLKYGFNRNKLVRHQYGYDPADFYSKDVDRPLNNSEGLNIVYVGECSPLKGIHFALEAWIKSKAAQSGKFYVCGNIIPGFEKILEPYMNHPSIIFKGFVSNVTEVMQQCDALILPSLAEGSALVTYEARASGCVLIVSSASGAICEHMTNSLVHEPSDIDQLRAHIDMLVVDHALLHKLRSNSLGSIDTLTWDHALSQVIETYEHHLHVSTCSDS